MVQMDLSGLWGREGLGRVGSDGVQQFGCTQACPERMCREKQKNPATPFPVKEEVADFLPGVQGRMGQAAQGVTHVGRTVGLAGVALCPERGLPPAGNPRLEPLSSFPEEPGARGNLDHLFSFVLGG